MSSQILSEEEIRDMKHAYISDRTSYLRGLTEVEPKKNLITDDFLRKNRVMVGFLDKWMPLANFRDHREKQLHKLKMINAQLAIDNGCYDTADETLISAWDDINMSRGWEGFFQNALNTERHEIQEEHKSDTEKKVGFFNKLFGRKPSDEQQGGQSQ